MTVKLVGAVLVLISATAIGFLLSMQIKEQEQWLVDIKMSLFLLEGELEYHQIPLPEALHLTGKKHGGRMQKFYLCTAEKLEKKEEGPLGYLWEKTAEEVLKSVPLKKEQKEGFMEIGRYLAEADSNVRKNALEFYFSRLEEEIVCIRETGREKARLYRILGLLGGIFLLVVAI